MAGRVWGVGIRGICALSLRSVHGVRLVPPTRDAGHAALRPAKRSRRPSPALAIVFFFRRDPTAHTRLLVWREGDATVRLSFEDTDFTDTRLDLSSVLTGDGGRVVLSFEGDNPTDAPDVVVQYFESRLFAEPLPAPPSLPSMVLAAFALGMCFLPLASWRRLLPVWAILTLGFALRYYALTQVLFLPLDWDTVGYHHLAKQMALFRDPGFFSARFGDREPLFILVVKAVLRLLGDSETHVRLVSFFGSLIVVLLTYRVGTRMFGDRLGLLGAFVMAITLPLVRESARGMRLELELMLLLVWVEAAFLSTVRSWWLRGGLSGCLAGLLSLTRVTYLVTLAPLLPFAMVHGKVRRPWMAAGFALLLLGSLQLPHRWNLYRLHGDLFWDVGQHAQWNAEVEFTGQPGPASRREMGSAPQGSPLSYGEYLFGLHTVPEVAVGTVRGFWKTIRHMEVVAYHRGVARLTGVNVAFADAVFQVAGILGLLLAFARPAFRWIPVTFLVLLLPISFPYDRGVIEAWRHTYQAFPWILFGALLVLFQLVAANTSRDRLSGVG